MNKFRTVKTAPNEQRNSRKALTTKEMNKKLVKVVHPTNPSIPFTRAEDKLDCLGPGFYNPKKDSGY